MAQTSLVHKHHQCQKLYGTLLHPQVWGRIDMYTVFKICKIAINFHYRPFQPQFLIILHEACEACSHHGKLRYILNGWSEFYHLDLQHAATKLSMVHASKARPGAPRGPRSAGSSCTRGSCRSGRGPWLNMVWNGFKWFPHGLTGIMTKFYKLIVIHS